MTTIFVYEFCCALGLGREHSDPAHSLYREGRAMQDALAADFAALPDIHVETLENAPAEEEPKFRHLAAAADWTVVIAPEFDRILESRCNWVRQSGGQLLGPNADAVRLTADKYALFEHWNMNGVPTPQTWLIEEFAGENSPDFRSRVGLRKSTPERTSEVETGLRKSTPIVVKPRYGAGSTDTELVESNLLPARTDALVQEYIPGQAASVSFLVGDGKFLPLVPSFQKLSDDGLFQYRGGELPIPPDLATRAIRIATRAIACVPGLLGYIGVDLVLGTNPDGSGDRAIEINPRMTTSYVGLRALAKRNLAGIMLDLANGKAAEPLEWLPDSITFQPDGTIERRKRTE